MFCELLKKIVKNIMKELYETNVIMAEYVKINCASPLLPYGRV